MNKRKKASVKGKAISVKKESLRRLAIADLDSVAGGSDSWVGTARCISGTAVSC